MKRERLETYLGKRIMVVLTNGDIFSGYLRKTRTEEFKEDPNLYLPQNWYFFTETKESRQCNSHLFRCSHVKNVTPLNEREEA